MALVVALGVLATARRARACSVCGCGDPLVSISDARPTSGRFRVGLDFEHLSMTARSDDDPTLTERLTQATFRPVLIYSPSNRWNLVLQVPLTWKSWALGGPAGDVQRSKAFGLGDVDLSARLFVFDEVELMKQLRWNLAFSVGTSFPTGPDDLKVGGERIDDHAQLGTGAFGPYVGAFFAWHRDPWNVFASATARTHSTNAYGYRFGDALLFGVRTEYRIVDRFAVGLGLDGRQAARDTRHDVPQENTGGFVLAITPGIVVNVIEPDLWFYLRVQVPVATHLYGEQTVGPTVLASLQYAFSAR
jgi:hypothetical protein